MVCYEFEGNVFVKLFIAQDDTNGGMCVVYKLLGADSRVFTRSLEDWNNNFTLLKHE